jgi:hypothetical protein
MNSPTPSNPLHHVNEWDDIVTEPLQGGQAGVGVPQVRCQGNPGLLQGRGAARPNVQELKPYYEDLVAEFFLAQLAW